MYSKSLTKNILKKEEETDTIHFPTDNTNQKESMGLTTKKKTNWRRLDEANDWQMRPIWKRTGTENWFIDQYSFSLKYKYPLIKRKC